MKTKLFLVWALAAMTLALAGTAFAGTTIPIEMTLSEPAVNPGCTVTSGFCGSGEILSLGQATDTIEFGACGPDCDLRTLTLADGSIVIHETASNFECPGNCGPRGAGFPSTVTLTDTIVGGTGVFSGATGGLTGEVVTAGGANRVKLSGSITLADA